MNARRLPILLALLVLAAVPARPATPLQYDQALGRVQAVLQAQTAASRTSPAASTPLPHLVAARLLLPIHMLERPQAEPVPVDTRFLLHSLARADGLHDPQQRIRIYKALVLQIAFLRSSLNSAAAGARADGQAAAAIEASRRVLAEPAYSSDPVPTPPAWETNFARWLERLLGRMHGPTYHGPEPHINVNVVRTIVYILTAAALALIVGVVVVLLNRRPVRSRPLALDDTEAALVEARDTDSLLALAEQQARQGDYRRAFRLVYVATLVALDTGGVLRFDRSKTNWEYLRALRAAGRDDVYQAMTPLAHDFDRVWYGFAAAGAGDYARALAQYRAFQAAPQAAQAG